MNGIRGPADDRGTTMGKGEKGPCVVRMFFNFSSPPLPPYRPRARHGGSTAVNGRARDDVVTCRSTGCTRRSTGCRRNPFPCTAVDSYIFGIDPPGDLFLYCEGGGYLFTCIKNHRVPENVGYYSGNSRIYRYRVCE